MTSLAFSSNGKWLLVGTSGDVHYIVDAFEGTLLYRLVGHTGLERGKSGRDSSFQPVRNISGEELSWTPDSRFVIGGSVDGKIFAWDLSDETKIPVRPAGTNQDPEELGPIRAMEGHPGVTRCVKFNPRYALIASAGAELVSRSNGPFRAQKVKHFLRQAFWLPDNGPQLEEARAIKGKAPAP
jgi:COMPASS component SWD2